MGWYFHFRENFLRQRIFSAVNLISSGILYDDSLTLWVRSEFCQCYYPSFYHRHNLMPMVPMVTNKPWTGFGKPILLILPIFTNGRPIVTLTHRQYQCTLALVTSFQYLKVKTFGFKLHLKEIKMQQVFFPQK